MPRKLTTEEFITKARKVHGNKYDYSSVHYVNAKTAIIIICMEHGKITQMPSDHLSGRGCIKCAAKRISLKLRRTTEQFITKAKQVHGYKYDYSKVIYVNDRTKVIIICPLYGEFLQSPSNHLSGKRCLICSGLKKMTTEEFIIKARKAHGNKYDYSKTVYANSWTKVIIICPVHGEFTQRSNGHLNGSGCLECAGLKKLTIKIFINKARKIHGNKYDYSKVNYINTHTNVIITCPEHGKFQQMPYHHLAGCGCPNCKKSKGEIEVTKILDKKNIKYFKQKIFSDCINPKTKCRLKYDFYLPRQNLLIEFNGLQHYVANKHWHQNGQSLEYQQYRDSVKKDYALSHGFKFLVIKYTDKNIEEILNKEIFLNNKIIEKNNLDM
jgi:ferredoxin-like protein FixX